MTYLRTIRSAARGLPPGRLVLMLMVVLTFLAACGPASGGTSGY